MKKILIVEDHPVVAEVTRALFMTMSFDVEICTNADDAIEKLQKNKNDWHRILLDISIPGANGLSLIRHVQSIGLAERSAVLTASEELQWRVEVEAMRFLGYVVKTASVEEFNFALNEIMLGRSYFCKLNFSGQPTHLTQRQTEILKLLHDGFRTKEIAKNLKLSPGTVDNHIYALINALRAKDRAHAVAIGMNLGYIKNSYAQ